MNDVDKKKRNQQIAVVVGVVVVWKLRGDVKTLKQTVSGLSQWSNATTDYINAMNGNLEKVAAVSEKALELAAKAKK